VTLTWSSVGSALLWSAVAGLGMWFLLIPLRRRSLAGSLASLVFVGAAASAGAMWGAVNAMLVSWSDWQTMIVLTALSGVVTAVAAVAAARRLAADNDVLRLAVTEVGEGKVPSADGRRLSAEIAQVREELRTTASVLAATRERERALEAARRELVSWISHDLRTPLAGLRAMAEALEDGVGDNPDMYVKQITAAVDRLTNMVEDLFDISRIQAGELTYHTDVVPLHHLLAECVAALSPLAAANGVRLSMRAERPASAVGNSAELNRAMTNLLANGIRHTPEGGVVEIRLCAAKDHPGELEITVLDECGGIPAEHLDRVFDVGFRGEAARTPRSGLHPPGAGLGLAITRGIVEAHQGTVAVHNTATGCAFRVRLPEISD